MSVVCLPNPEALELASPLPDSVTVRLWDGSAEPPAELADVEFWVPSYMFSDHEQRAAAYRAMPRLRVVQLTSAGADVFVGDVPSGVLLCDGRGVHGGSTAEWAMTAMLSVVRDFPQFVRDQDQRRWSPHTTDELIGKRVVVIGAGDLGQSLARRLRAFDAEPTLVARHARDDIRAMDELPSLLPEADIVVLMVPLTSSTRGLVDAQFLAQLRDGALVVNAARGPVVDTDALFAELSRGRLRAALDVTDPEPLPDTHPLWGLPNVLITPHVGGNTSGYPARGYALVRSQIERFVHGQDLENVVQDEY